MKLFVADVIFPFCTSLWGRRRVKHNGYFNFQCFTGQNECYCFCFWAFICKLNIHATIYNLQDSSFIWIHISDYYLSLKPQSSNILFEQWVVGSLNNHCASHVSILTNLCRTELWHPIQKASFLCNHSSKSHEIFTKYRWIVIYLTCQTASIFIFIFKSY